MALSADGSKRLSIEELRSTVQHAQQTVARLESRLDALDAELSALCSTARQCGYSGPLPQSRTAASNRGAVLLYHRIATISPDVASLCTPPEVFRVQMEYLARTCEPMTLSALVKAAEDGDLPRRAVAITLDDGYADSLMAADILTALHVPATYFVNSSAGGETLLDSLTRIFLEGQAIPESLELSILGTTINFSCAEETSRRATFDILRELAWPLSSEGRRELVAAVRRWSGLDLAPRASHRVLTPAELRDLDNRQGQQIGAHTDNHLFLPSQPRSTKINEIATNRDYLEAVLGRSVDSFAYPYGAFDRETVFLCRGLGIRTCVTVSPEAVRPWTDPWLVPRYEVKTHTPHEFEALVNRIYS